MHKSQEVLPVHILPLLQSAQGSPVHFEILLPQWRDIVFRNAEPVAHVYVHAVPDAVPQTCGRGIKCVIKVEEDGCKTHLAIIPSWRSQILIEELDCVLDEFRITLPIKCM